MQKLGPKVMETIRLYRSEHAWISDFGEDGGFTLPFTRNASPAVVLAHVAERNPDTEVFIDFIGDSANGQPSPVQMFIDTVSGTPEWMQSARGAA